MPEEITTNYYELVNALRSAIEKEAAENGNQFVTDEKIETPIQPTFDFKELTEKFQSLVGQLMEKDQSNSIKITNIVEKYLGKGKKVSECNAEQCEQIDLINSELEDMLK